MGKLSVTWLRVTRTMQASARAATAATRTPCWRADGGQKPLRHYDSIDCDGQDDINAMDAMVDAYRDGCDVVYGVRSKRETDTFFKRFTAESFYKILNAMGAEVVFNHADYRLMSARVLEEFRPVRGRSTCSCAAWCRWSASSPPA